MLNVIWEKSLSKVGSLGTDDKCTGRYIIYPSVQTDALNRESPVSVPTGVCSDLIDESPAPCTHTDVPFVSIPVTASSSSCQQKQNK